MFATPALNFPLSSNKYVACRYAPASPTAASFSMFYASSFVLKTLWSQ